MLVNKIIIKTVFFVLINAIILQFSVAMAGSYSAFPGKLPAKLITVNSASDIEVSAETWPGSRQNFNISLSGIQVPLKDGSAKQCQRELAEQALDFVRGYLENARKIEVQNLTMQTSVDTNVTAEIFTEQGSLGDALMDQGLARSNQINPGKPWC